VRLVDDSAVAREILSAQLRIMGLRVTQAESGEAALAALVSAARSRSPFAVAMIGRVMPGMSGEELGRRVAAEPSLGAIKTLLFTTSGLRGDAARAEQLGFSAYLSKPISQSVLYATLAEMLGDRPADGATGKAPSLLTAHSITETRPSHYRVLVAEDNRVNQMLVVAMLEKHGHRVERGRERVGSGRRGQGSALRSGPDGHPDAGDGRRRGDAENSRPDRRGRAHPDHRLDR
jgi:CheY-like chemotaxis protein